MVLNNVTKFHKILIKSIRHRERTSLGQTYVRTDGRTGVTLNAPAIGMAGDKNTFCFYRKKFLQVRAFEKYIPLY